MISLQKSPTEPAKIIKNKDEIAYELEKAYHIATTGRPGPVWIDIPLDIQAQEIDIDKIKVSHIDYINYWKSYKKYD